MEEGGGLGCGLDMIILFEFGNRKREVEELYLDKKI